MDWRAQRESIRAKARGDAELYRQAEEERKKKVFTLPEFIGRQES
ncbi:hypothetical protein ACPOL_7228 (plasmid) [Acidisarcina polymorpha]|uniref:Uncharacterized protein n=1 Tax=Acidisarcina polymorpha TaxID=2211140 RepID=A0A2Z5G9P3_9BACT|nr:hypothetical protein ACPOL_6792 [Acidisarcina polymorpha]AXC16200.1 hypothetical protein ACPOL_6998 [Acidisarcina polymorpha]AXC16418.1 hypothetical protein ACPOL_7228 [Acidisarcina polymorpha]